MRNERFGFFFMRKYSCRNENDALLKELKDNKEDKSKKLSLKEKLLRINE